MCIAVKPVEYSSLYSYLTNLTQVIDNWNSKAASKSLELDDLIKDLIAAIKCAGPFSAQYFAKVLIRLGIINHPGLAQEAVLNERSHAYKTVAELSGATTPKEKAVCAARFLKTAASVLGVTPAVVEKLLCEQYRDDKKCDFLFPLQPILSVVDIKGVPTMYKYHQDGTKVISRPICLHMFPLAEPPNRPLNESWWVEPSARGVAPTGEIVFTVLTAAEKK